MTTYELNSLGIKALERQFRALGWSLDDDTVFRMQDAHRGVGSTEIEVSVLPGRPKFVRCDPAHFDAVQSHD